MWGPSTPRLGSIYPPYPPKSVTILPMLSHFVHTFFRTGRTHRQTDRGQTAQAAPALTQEILIPWGGLQPPHSNIAVYHGPPTLTLCIDCVMH